MDSINRRRSDKTDCYLKIQESCIVQTAIHIDDVTDVAILYGYHRV